METKAPNVWGNAKPAIFMAGSIEMGKADNWQERLVKLLPDSWELLNPRRDNWDPSWVQDPPSEKFKEQVNWELKAMAYSDIVSIYFDPNTKSPVSLLEFGLYARTAKLIVCCPPGFWRRGNLIITCERYGVPFVDSIEELASAIKLRLSSLGKL